MLMILKSLSPELKTFISNCLLGFCTLCTYYRNLRHIKGKSELITCPTMLLLFLIPSVHRSGIYLVTQTRNWAAPLNILPLHAVNHQVMLSLLLGWYKGPNWFSSPTHSLKSRLHTKASERSF